MKRKYLSALVIVGALFLTACQEDDTMDELIQDTSASAFEKTGTSGGDANDNGQGSGGVGGN